MILVRTTIEKFYMHHNKNHSLKMYLALILRSTTEIPLKTPEIISLLKRVQEKAVRDTR